MPPFTRLPEVFNENYWVLNSKQLSNYLDDNSIISLDMTKLRWADPVPLLWLCLILRNRFNKYCNLKAFNKIKLKINFQSRSVDHRRFLCFFVQQGFFSQYSKYGDFYFNDEAEMPSQNFIVSPWVG